MRSQLLQEMLDALLALVERVRVLLLESEESLLGREDRDEEARVLDAESLSEKVKIAVPALDLRDRAISQKVELRGPRSEGLNLELVVALVNDVVLVPAQTCHLYS